MTALAAIVSTVLLVIAGLSASYWALLLAASFRRPAPPSGESVPRTRFLVAIPAHDEESVIGATVRLLMAQDYPRHLFAIHVVADHCSDRTAEVARAAGAVSHERLSGPRGGKGAALSWLFQRVLSEPSIDAVVVFDADSKVEPSFLRRVDRHFARGSVAVQGQHVISNAGDGWFAALTWAMFLVDNQVQNHGRTVLGLSSKNMGDGIAVSARLLRLLDWGSGLTEDYELRLRLVMDGHTIVYEPGAVSLGEAVPTLAAAYRQRQRWLRGARDASHVHRLGLIRAALRTGNPAVVDAAVQSVVPSYSTIAVVAMAGWSLAAAEVAPFEWTRVASQPSGTWGWALVFSFCVVYPYLGLLSAGAPARAYMAIGYGPAYVAWRTWVAATSVLRRSVVWHRTPRRAGGM